MKRGSGSVLAVSARSSVPEGPRYELLTSSDRVGRMEARSRGKPVWRFIDVPNFSNSCKTFCRRLISSSV